MVCGSDGELVFLGIEGKRTVGDHMRHMNTVHVYMYMLRDTLQWLTVISSNSLYTV